MIMVDSREGSGDMASLFPSTVAVSLSHLDYADFMFLGSGPDDQLVTIGIERKAIRDLINSMVTGRLSGHQLPGLTSSYDYVYLLVEGVWRFDPDSGILQTLSGAFWTDLALGQRRFMAKEVLHFLNTLVIKAGIHLMYSNSKRESVQVISSLYSWWNSKQFDQHVSHLSPNKAHKGAHGEVMLMKPSLVRRVAAELPGIGWGKSLSVSTFFPSVYHMAIAEEKDWRKVPGIGKGLAMGAVEAIRKMNEVEGDT